MLITFSTCAAWEQFFVAIVLQHVIFLHYELTLSIYTYIHVFLVVFKSYFSQPFHKGEIFERELVESAMV
jgi:hypothetical protein